MAPVIGFQLRRHRLHLAVVEHVEKQGLQNVVTMVAKRDLARPDLAGYPIQNAASQARAKRACRLARRHQALDDGIGILFLDVKRHAAGTQIVGQYMGGKAGLFLVKVDRDQVERNRRARAQHQQNFQHAIAVLAAGQADHHAITVFDHVEIADRLPDLARQALGQLVGFEHPSAVAGTEHERLFDQLLHA